MQTFSKNERLCSKVLIDKLVEKGRSFNSFPFRVKWLEITDSPAPVQIVISIPKRNFKRSVDRNKLKRQIKEVYRKEKQKIYNTLENKNFLLMLVYTSKNKMEFKELEGKVIDTLQHFSKEVNL